MVQRPPKQFLNPTPIPKIGGIGSGADITGDSIMGYSREKTTAYKFNPAEFTLRQIQQSTKPVNQPGFKNVGDLYFISLN